MNRWEVLQLKGSIPSGSKVYCLLLSRDFCKTSVFERFKHRHRHHPRTHCNHWGYRKGSRINKLIYKWKEKLYRTLSNMGKTKSHKNIKLINFCAPNGTLVNLSSKAKMESKNTWDVRP